MANLQIPPQPIDDNNPSSVAWSDWYNKVRYAMNTSGINWNTLTDVPANIVNFGALSLAANKGIYATGTNTFSTFDLSAFVRSISNAADAETFRTSIDAGQTITDLNTQNVDYTTVAADKGKTILHTSATGHTHTIAAEASVNYALGTVISFCNDGTGTVTIAIGGADTLVWSPSGSTGSRTLASNGRASALKIGTGRWQIAGGGLT